MHVLRDVEPVEAVARDLDREVRELDLLGPSSEHALLEHLLLVLAEELLEADGDGVVLDRVEEGVGYKN